MAADSIAVNGRTRDEVLDVELFYTLAEAKVILADWLTAYNTEHPHSALGMLPLARFAERWRAENGAPTPRSDRPAGSLREVSVNPATVAADTDQELSLGVRSVGPISGGHARGKSAFADGLVENLSNDHWARRNWPATVELSGRIWCPAAARGEHASFSPRAWEPITYSRLKLTIYGPPRFPTPKTLHSFGHRGLKGRVFWQRMHPTAEACQIGYSLYNPFPTPARPPEQR